MKINKYFVFAFIYFFINSLGLPQGLLFTSLLSPLLYWWVVSTRRFEIMLPFVIAILPFFIVQAAMGINLGKYLVSLLNMATVYIFCQAFYTFLLTCQDPEKIFRRLLIITFVLCIIAIPFYSSSYYHVFWIKQFLTEGVDNYKRLKLFTYEASYFATLFTPLFFFYFLQIILRQNRINAWLLFVLIFTPYLLSFSLGVIATVLISLAIIFLLYPAKLLRKRRVLNLAVMIVTLVSVGLVAAVLFFPNNTLFIRLANIFTGNDISGKGRTTDAFLLSNMILDQRSHFWGIGPGQLRVLGTDIIKNFYSYPSDYDVVAIPNASAETLVIFGWLGLSTRILTEIVLFFYTKVYRNYYRLALFFFMFIYQFTGSYITSPAEYVIWILAFTNAFPQFNVNPIKYTHQQWPKKLYGIS